MALSLVSEIASDAARVPPHSANAERACLGSVLIKPAALDDLAELSPNDFFVPPHADVLEAMRSVAARGRSIDPVTIGDELKARGALGRLEGGIAFLVALTTSTPTAENVKHYAAEVTAKAALRRTIALCAEVASAAYNGVESAEDFLADARQKFAGIEIPGLDGPVSVPDDVDRVVSEMEKRGLNPERYLISTGIDSLDGIITGLFPQTVTIIAANPSRGKTGLALNTVIRAAMRGVPCLFFSLEMSRAQIIERALAFQARINGRAITQGKLSQEQWYAVGTTAHQWQEAKIPIWIDERVHAASRLCAVARKWRAQRRTERLAAGMSEAEADLAVIAIDYLGLVRGDGETESRRMEVAAMSRAFKRLAKTEKVAVILCAQLNRQNMKEGTPRQPNLSDLRDAGEIEQDADVVLFPWWEGTPPALGGPFDAEILVRKNRNGPTGEAPIIWEREYMTFRDRDRNDYQETRFADAE
jgi:replicative DNA helicase